uniref:uncharacterized protein LOC101298970 isoform X4 n=1 Tax=Fragaria vesca subsp. vesca TaxID=101020 RepID=UPI0005C847B2|nr:PREDICTED: uncharacterized protein LOC101298970 isoform X4 [Fragaria vesca subsp. vesca]
MKREFRYERGSHPDQNNCWLMQEFEMDVNDSLVLCTLRKKPSPAVVVAVQESNTTRKRNDPCGNDDSNHLKRLRLDQPTSNSTAEMVLDEDPISDALLDECLGGTSGLPSINDPSLFDITNDANADSFSLIN